MLVGNLYLVVALAALLPGTQPPSSGGVDHYLHTLVFGGLTLITFAAFPRAWITASAVFGTSILIEAGQMFVPERTASMDDVAANAIGVLIAALAILIWRRIRAAAIKAKWRG